MTCLVAGTIFAAALLAGDRMPEKDLEAYLQEMQRPGARYANIEASEGAYLRDLVKKVNAKRAVEIGTSTGYSGIWIARGLSETGGKLITIEFNAGRYETAVRNFKATGFDDIIEARHADALKETPTVAGPLDFVFIDANKPDYLKYYEMVLPKMRKGGVIVAHNTVSHGRDMQDFLDRIKSDPAVRTEIVTPGSQGFSVTWVK